MASMYLRNLSSDETQNLKTTLWENQLEKCFICDKPIDRLHHWGSIDIDHVIPLTSGGKDDPNNFALTHSSCNRSKQASNLEIARILAKYDTVAESTGGQPGRPHLGDLLESIGGSSQKLLVSKNSNSVSLSFTELGSNQITKSEIIKDELSGIESFFAHLPIEYLHHDARINPRAIASKSLRALAEEFYAGNPQLHTALGWVQLQDSHESVPIRIFDGQHKLAAQILLGARKVPVRVFLNPDMDRLLTANTNAGTKLRQVAFDKSVQRHLGSQLLADRITEYLAAMGRDEDDLGFSESDLLNHFKGQRKEIRRYILDDVRDRVTHSSSNKLRDYIDFGGRGTEKPLSYSSIEKTFYSFFIGSQPLTTRMDHKFDAGENPRDLEVEQLVTLMNIVQKVILDGEFLPSIGTSRIERRLQDGKEVIPEGHIRAVRMLKEEILYTWLERVRLVIEQHFVFAGTGVNFQISAPMQVRFTPVLWEQIERFVSNLSNLPIWQNRALSSSVFGGKQTYDFWRTIFNTGESPTGQKILAQPLNLKSMIQ